jgi:hypothetical protein
VEIPRSVELPEKGKDGSYVGVNSFLGQTVNITHRYEKPGTYEVHFTWRDRRDFGNTAVLTTTVAESLAPNVEQLGEISTDLVLDADFFDELD